METKSILSVLALLLAIGLVGSFMYMEAPQKVNDLENKVSELETQISDLNTTVEDKNTKIAEIKEELKATETALETKKGDYTALEDKVSDLKDELENKKDYEPVYTTNHKETFEVNLSKLDSDSYDEDAFESEYTLIINEKTERVELEGTYDLISEHSLCSTTYELDAEEFYNIELPDWMTENAEDESFTNLEITTLDAEEDENQVVQEVTFTNETLPAGEYTVTATHEFDITYNEELDELKDITYEVEDANDYYVIK